MNGEHSKPDGEKRTEYMARIVRGGFPLAVRRGDRARNRWFDDYVRQVVERDIPGIARIRNKRGLLQLVRYAASQTAQILTLEKFSAAAAIDVATAKDYLQLLEDVFLVFQLPAWGRTLTAAVSAKPKLHILDSGMAARLLGLSAERLGGKEPAVQTEAGHLLESFTVSEIMRELSWLDDTVMAGHWNTHDGNEADLVLETMDGSVFAFEIKAGSLLQGGDFKGLAALRKYTGNAFKAGVVLYTGSRAYRQDENIFAIPISRMWQASLPPQASLSS